MQQTFRWARAITLLCVALLFSTLPIYPAAARTPTPEPILRRYDVYGVRDAATQRTINRTGATITERSGNYAEIIATSDEAQKLIALGFVVRESERPMQLPPVDPAYHTYDETAAAVAAAAARYPSVVQRFSIGQSYEGRELWAIKISDNVAADEPEPEALLVGHYHAREHLTTEMMLYLLQILTSEYDSNQPNSQITQLVNSREIFLIFDMNPDGGVHDTAGTSYRFWRKNRQPNAGSDCIGTDPNRNHSYRWGGAGSTDDPCDILTYRGAAPASTPEVAAMERFVNSRVISGTQQIRVAISFHTFGELILWPYGYTEEDVPADMRPNDAAAFAAMGQAMAATNGYRPSQSSDLYQTTGDLSDWAYGTHRIFAFTFEMYPCNRQGCPDDGFYPPGEVIATQTARNREAVLYLLEQADCPYQTIGKAELCPAPQAAPSPLVQVWLPFVSD